MRQSDSLVKFAPAFLKAQKALKKAQKDGLNPHFGSKFPTFESVWDACVPALHDNELMVVQRPENTKDGATIHTMLLHVSGEFMEDDCFVPCARPNDPQAIGSAMTYARRYSLEAMAGIIRDDDDAEGATNHSTKPGAPLGTEAVKRAADPRPEPPMDVGSQLSMQGGRPPPLTFRFGLNKGKTSHEVSDKDLSWYISAAQKSIDDPEKAAHKSKNVVELAALQAELRWRNLGH